MNVVHICHLIVFDKCNFHFHHFINSLHYIQQRLRIRQQWMIWQIDQMIPYQCLENSILSLWRQLWNINQQRLVNISVGRNVKSRAAKLQIMRH